MTEGHQESRVIHAESRRLPAGQPISRFDLLARFRDATAMNRPFTAFLNEKVGGDVWCRNDRQL